MDREKKTSDSFSAVRFDGISKSFPGVRALDDVSFEVARGSCHALCGENGAGKSTLGRVLAGIYSPDAGRLILDGREVTFATPAEALEAGIGMVHQELAFCENLSIAENLCLRALPARASFVSRANLRAHAQTMLDAIGAKFDVDRRVGTLSLADQQLLQIAAAVGHGARVVVFDEPTSSLSQHEADKLFDLIAQLKAGGVTCLYVSHRMDEIFRLCDAITVLRDGRHVATQPASTLNPASLVHLMIGRTLADVAPAVASTSHDKALLRVEGLSSPGRFQDISFTVHAGEVVGVAGLVGAGRTDVARAIFGLDQDATGRIWIDGREGLPRHPEDAMRRGVGLVPEDRKRQGLVLLLPARANATLAVLPSLSRWTIVRQRAERALAQSFFARLHLRAASPEVTTAALSGGNQQKIVIAKWLAAKCPILMLDEPTRGVDVGAKAEIHGLVAELAAAGHAVLLISSELPELLQTASRILVFRSGRLAGNVPRADATEAGLLRLMAGVA